MTWRVALASELLDATDEVLLQCSVSVIVVGDAPSGLWIF